MIRYFLLLFLLIEGTPSAWAAGVPDDYSFEGTPINFYLVLGAGRPLGDLQRYNQSILETLIMQAKERYTEENVGDFHLARQWIINLADKTLSDPKRREAYNRFLASLNSKDKVYTAFSQFPKRTAEELKGWRSIPESTLTVKKTRIHSLPVSAPVPEPRFLPPPPPPPPPRLSLEQIADLLEKSWLLPTQQEREAEYRRIKTEEISRLSTAEQSLLADFIKRRRETARCGMLYNRLH